jgi:hypothetical protein
MSIGSLEDWVGSSPVRSRCQGIAMQKINPFTRAAITRAIKAAQAAGLKIVGVRPDGTVLTEASNEAPVSGRLTEPHKARDAREKLGVG